jgi:hypothetical protein
MEELGAELSRSLYADYGAMALLVILNVATSFILFRYFSAELRGCRERREQSDADWRARYDSLSERMLAQIVAQSQTLERMAERTKTAR